MITRSIVSDGMAVNQVSYQSVYDIKLVGFQGICWSFEIPKENDTIECSCFDVNYMARANEQSTCFGAGS